uniref:Uncharacterized protein n=1 Tax=Tetraselmis sp. GSL018 TaxID=582737 RepID=A0A061QZW4_9CHLO
MPPNQSIQPEKTDNECLDLHNASLDCQIKHGRGEACRTLIEAYKTCKKEWQKRVRDERRAANEGGDFAALKRWVTGSGK